MNSPAIEFLGTTKIYSYGFLGKKQKALHNLNLTVPQGAIYGFLGANGAGKTTGIKMLIGLQFATEGSVRIFGKSPEDSDAKSRIGYLPERPYFHDTLTANQFLNFHRNLFGNTLRGKTLLNNLELMNLVGLPDVSGKLLKDFSKGMLQRIGIAQALVNNPDLVILDEPMSGLDPIGRRDVRDLILSLAKNGKTIFFSSHILTDVESLCHRICFLEKGVLKHEGEVKSIQHQENGKIEVLFTLEAEKVLGNPVLKEAHRVGDNFIIHSLSGDEAKKVIEEVWAQRGKLLNYQPEIKTLEQVLFGEKDRV